MAEFTEAEKQEFERVWDEDQCYKCPYCPYKDGCGLWSCPNEIGQGEWGEMDWKRPFSAIEGFKNFGLHEIDTVLPDGVSAPVDYGAKNIVDLIELCFDSVKVYHRYFEDWTPGADVFHYFFVDPKSKTKTIELWEDLVSRVSFAQEVEEGSLDMGWIAQAEVTELQWMAPIYDAYNSEDALISAIENGLTGMAKILMESGNDLDAKDYNGGSALHVAAGVGLQEIVRLLIDKNADLEAQDNDGRTPLISAALGEEVETARILLAAGADPDVTDGEGKGIRDLLKRRRREQVFLDLLSAP
jgi:hypothetical protein